jgi:PPK2 family polyphosphate:nucleotide phosphotransferase
LDHDYLWRTSTRTPERGRIGVFNRSYYEEVLVVLVHPEIQDNQKLLDRPEEKEIWPQRYESIRNFEKHLALNGTVILKFWLNVSKQEQCNRFLSRIDEPEKNWKFSEADIKEREYWDDYMDAYEQALRETSREWAPWYAIPADNKPYMRYTVAKIIAETMASLNMHYPRIDDEARQRFNHLREMLVNDQ